MAVILVGCGGSGGSGGEGTEPPTPDQNQPPAFSSVSVDALNGEAVSIDLADHASDPDGDTLEIKSLGEPKGGTVSSSGLTVTYDPDDGFAGTESIDVTITDGTDDVSGTITITAYQGMSISGQVVDEPIPGARVKVEIGGEVFEAVADSEGNYVLEIQTLSLDSYVKVTATGAEGSESDGIELVSLLGEIGTMLEAAGADRAIGGEGDNSANVTNVTTARYVLAIEANEGQEITSDDEMETAEKSIDGDKLLEIAAVIKVVLDNPDHDLPEGFDSVLDFVSDTEAYNEFVAEVTSENPEDNALTQAMDQIVNDPALVQGFTQEGIASVYYSTFPAAPGFLSRGGDRYEFSNDGTGTVANEGGSAEFSWSIENGELEVTYDEPLEYYTYFAVDGVLEPAVAAQWYEATNGWGQIGAFISEESVKFTRLVDGNIIDTVSFEMNAERVFDMLDTGVSAPSETEWLSNGRLLLRDADASMPLPIVAADLEQTWAADSYYEYEVASFDGPVSQTSYAGDLFQFVEGGTGVALLSGRAFTWALENNSVRLNFDDETSQLVQKIDEAGDLSAFALRTFDSEGDLLAFSYNFGTWQDESDALTAGRVVTEAGHHWATFVNGWFAEFWDGGVFDYIAGSGFGWEFNQDGTATNVSFFYDGLDEDGDGDAEEVMDLRGSGTWSIGADGVLALTRHCPNDCRRREWLGLQATGDEIIVMERESYGEEAGGPLVFPARVNIYRVWESPEVNRALQPVSVRAIAYPTLEIPGKG